MDPCGVKQSTGNARFKVIKNITGLIAIHLWK